MSSEPEPVGGIGTSAGKPRRQWSTAANITAVVGGNGTSLVLTMAAGLLVARALPPREMGVLATVALVMRYAPLLQLGVTTALYRELPLELGRGSLGRARSLAASAQGWSILIGLVLGIVLASMGLWHAWRGNIPLAAAWFSQALIGSIYYYHEGYLTATFRTAQDFSRLAGVGVAESITSLVLVAVVWALGFYGQCIRVALVPLVAALCLHLARPIKVQPTIVASDIRHLLWIGAPMLAAGQYLQMWTVVNATLIAALLGPEQMGLFALVGMAGDALAMVPRAATQVTAPQMTQTYGATANLRAALKTATRPVIAIVLLVAPAVAVAQFAVGPVVEILLPRYTGAIPALRWALLAPLVATLQPFATAFVIVRRQRLHVLATTLGMLAYATTLLVARGDELTLEAFVRAMVVGKSVAALAAVLLVLWLARKECGTNKAIPKRPVKVVGERARSKEGG